MAANRQKEKEEARGADKKMRATRLYPLTNHAMFATISILLRRKCALCEWVASSQCTHCRFVQDKETRTNSLTKNRARGSPSLTVSRALELLTTHLGPTKLDQHSSSAELGLGSGEKVIEHHMAMRIQKKIRRFRQKRRFSPSAFFTLATFRVSLSSDTVENAKTNRKQLEEDSVKPLPRPVTVGCSGRFVFVQNAPRPGTTTTWFRPYRSYCSITRAGHCTPHPAHEHDPTGVPMDGGGYGWRALTTTTTCGI